MQSSPQRHKGHKEDRQTGKPRPINRPVLCAFVVNRNYFESLTQYNTVCERKNKRPFATAGDAPNSSALPSPSLLRPTSFNFASGSRRTVVPLSSRNNSLPRTAIGEAIALPLPAPKRSLKSSVPVLRSKQVMLPL